MTNRVCTGVCLFALAAAAQNAPPAGKLPAQVGSASTPALYRFFFRHIAALDAQATSLDAQGKKGDDLRNYYQTLLNLTPSEIGLVKQGSATCMAAVKQLDSQAQTIIQAQKAQFPTGQVPSRDALPPSDPRLAQLTQQRDDATSAQIQALQAALSAKTFAKIDTYIKTQFARQVTSIPVVVHPPGAKPLTAAPTGGNK